MNKKNYLFFIIAFFLLLLFWSTNPVSAQGQFWCDILHTGQCMPGKRASECQPGYAPTDCSSWSNKPAVCQEAHSCVLENTSVSCISRPITGCSSIIGYEEFTFDCKSKSRCCKNSSDCESAFDSSGSAPAFTGIDSGIDFEKIQGTAFPSLTPEFQIKNNATAAEKVGNIISTILPYLFVFAGLILLFYLIAGGFQMMLSAGDEKALGEAKKKITNALFGFLLLFVSYWLVQIIEIILGITIF